MSSELRAADGLTLVRRGGALRVVWHGGDWLGPLDRLVAGRDEPVRIESAFEGRDDLGAYTAWHVGATDADVVTQVRAYADEPLLVFRCEARRALEGVASGRFDEPAFAWPRCRPALRDRSGWPDDASVFGHQYTEFALPTFSGDDFGSFALFGMRPAVVEPLWLRAGPHTLMLAPLEAFHDQVIAVPRSAEETAAGVRCGWHGDLDGVPQGFASELAVWGGATPRALAERLGALLRRRHGTRRRGRYADAAVGRLSYWTDNGAAYWYRTEPGLDVTETLGETLDGLRAQDVPVHAVELDSWFYPHEILRPIDDERIDVPPSGALLWEPRADALPDGIEALRERLGRPPLILHSRHFSSRSPYFERFEAWRDADRAHPCGAELFDVLMEQAARWGAVQYEQDWLVESYLGVRGLRERPGRARQWQEDLDRAAARHGLSLLWCMGTPADALQTVTLGAIGAMRTSGDYRYLLGSASLWCWFLYGNALARALGLLPFKDVFVSDPTGTGREGDPHAELEAALAALSAGPVGLGDRGGHTSREIALRTCRDDGLLVKPDVPIAALDRCLRRHALLHPDPLLAECFTRHAAGRWHYALGIHASRHEGEIAAELPLAELSLDEGVEEWLAWDWRRRTFERLGRDAVLAYRLAQHEWRLHVLCPVLAGGIALVGDPSKYATMGDARIRHVEWDGEALGFDVLGTGDETVRIEGWARGGAPAAEGWSPDGRSALELAASPSGEGGFRLAVPISRRGWTRVRLRP